MAAILTIETDKIKNASNLMLNNKDLTTWNSSLTLLENGTSMFSGCENLISFSTPDITKVSNEHNVLIFPALKNASYMFENTGLSNVYIGFGETVQNMKNVTTMEGMFKDCKNLEMAEICPFPENYISSLKKAFFNCGKNKTCFKAAISWDMFPNLTNIDYAFATDVKTVTSFPAIEIPAGYYTDNPITSASYAFDCRNIEDINEVIELLSSCQISSSTTCYLGRIYTENGLYTINHTAVTKLENSNIAADMDLTYNSNQITYSDCYFTCEGGGKFTFRVYYNKV